jgi:hypothetical protein
MLGLRIPKIEKTKCSFDISPKDAESVFLNPEEFYFIFEKEGYRVNSISFDNRDDREYWHVETNYNGFDFLFLFEYNKDAGERSFGPKFKTPFSRGKISVHPQAYDVSGLLKKIYECVTTEVRDENRKRIAKVHSATAAHMAEEHKKNSGLRFVEKKHPFDDGEQRYG